MNRNHIPGNGTHPSHGERNATPSPGAARATLREEAVSALRDIFGDDLLIGRTDLIEKYAKDMAGGSSWRMTPEAVVFPQTTEDVVRLMTVARTYRIPVTARGAGSGLAAGAVAAAGGIVCSLEKMNRIVEVDTENLAAVVEPGVVTRELDAALEPAGLFFAGYPMSEEICTIGGNVATNAGGGRAVKYGVTGHHVLGLQVVTAGGEVLNLGGKRLKDVTGLNLLPLFVGSEGVLGIITRITVRLTPRPGDRTAFLVSFASSQDATAAVGALRRSEAGVPSSIEYIDGKTAAGAAAQLWRNTPAPFLFDDSAGALLLVESEGRSRKEAHAILERYRPSIERHSGSVVVVADSPAALATIWKLRKAVPWWVKRQSGVHHSVEDVVVPSTAIPELVRRALELEASSGLNVAIFGHAGDGNFHINPMKPAAMSPAEWEARLHEFLTALYRVTVSLGGTISGEHGIGRKRTAALSLALSDAEIAVMRRLKDALDPDGILNPGVLLP